MLTDGRTDDGQKVFTIAHPEQSSDELKMMRNADKGPYAGNEGSDLRASSPHHENMPI